MIYLLRKPFKGSLAENALAHKCGGLNIDACRVGIELRTYKRSGASAQVYSESRSGLRDGRGSQLAFSAEGRWPANFILTHLEGCELKGTRKIKEGKVNKYNGGTLRKEGLYKDGLKKRAIDNFRGEEEVVDWACVEDCPVKELDRQSGVSKSTGGRIGNSQGAYSNLGETGFKDNAIKGDPGFGDTGGASRFFIQFRLEEK